VFCSVGGSGDFAASAVLPVSRKIEEAKRILGTVGDNGFGGGRKKPIHATSAKMNWTRFVCKRLGLTAEETKQKN